MATIRQDDRTEAEQLTHTVLVIGTDRCLSGWGGATGGSSIAAWACRPEDESRVLRWVEGRRDLSRVRVNIDREGLRYRPGRGCAHLHIYCAREGHPALGGVEVSR